MSTQKVDLLKNQFRNELASPAEQNFRSMNCEGVDRSPPIVFQPKDLETLRRLIKTISEMSLPYSVISSGQNWGYGSSLSIDDEDLVVDLSKLNTILSFDERLGIVEVQPGVTQQILFDYLEGIKSDWMAPTSGAGPNCSLIGNALERGFGLNPVSDHFENIICLEAILCNGDLFQSKLGELGAWRSDHVSKWKIGPYFEGLFGQSAFGVVIALKIQLAPKPQTVDLLIVKAAKNDLGRLVKIVRDIRRELNFSIGSVNISNKERISSTIDIERLGGQNSRLEKLLDLNVTDYMMVVPILNYSSSTKVAKRSVIYFCKKAGLKSVFLKEGRIRLLRGILHQVLRFRFLSLFLEAKTVQRMMSRLKSLLDLICLIKGQPNQFALKAAYTDQQIKATTYNPAHDGVGLFWFSPILGLLEEDFFLVEQITSRVLKKYGMTCMLTFTNFDHRLVEATIAIYFDRSDPASRERALCCWQDLYQEHLAVGIVPYRYSILHMNLTYVKGSHHDRLYKQIKSYFDPQDLMSRGRYGRLKDE